MIRTAFLGASLGLTAAAAFLSVSCSGDDSGGTSSAGCSTGSACGGDLVGVWDVTALCLDSDFNVQNGLPPACAGAQTVGAYTATGSFEFRADGTFSENIVLHVSSNLRLTDACLHAENVPAGAESSYCTTLEGELTAQSFTGSCSYASGACSCALTQDAPINKTGSYTLGATGHVLNDGDDSTYCVNGDTLSFGSTGDGGAGRIDFKRH